MEHIEKAVEQARKKGEHADRCDVEKPLRESVEPVASSIGSRPGRGGA